MPQFHLLLCNSHITFGISSMNSSSTAFRRTEDCVFDFSFPLCTCLGMLVAHYRMQFLRSTATSPPANRYFDSRPTSRIFPCHSFMIPPVKRETRMSKPHSNRPGKAILHQGTPCHGPWAVLVDLIQLQNGKIGVARQQTSNLCTRIWCTTQCHNTITCLWTPGPRELPALRYSAPDFTVHIKDRFLIPRNNSALKYWGQMLSICSRRSRVGLSGTLLISY